jgi:hypothetical protein
MMGRYAHFRAEADHHYPNLFLNLVGISSRRRKGSSWGYVSSLMESVDAAFPKSNVKGGLSSGEGPHGMCGMH